jgi:alkylhydroperoxidase family enzyme
LGSLARAVTCGSREDIQALTAELRTFGFSPEEIYTAVTVIALFGFYNKWVDGCGVEHMSAQGYAVNAQKLVQNGYELEKD